jgi:predicted transcriptional regulator YdeE
MGKRILVAFGLAMVTIVVVGIVTVVFFPGGCGMKEPRILDVERGFDCAGLSARTSDKTVFRDLPVLYAKYMKLKDGGALRNLKAPWQYVSLNTDFSSDNSSWTYQTGHVVTMFADESEGVVSFSTPPGKYAVFALRCRSKALFGFRMGMLKRFIYAKWLPASPYQFAGYEYEYNDESMYARSPYDIDLYVGIREKTISSR